MEIKSLSELNEKAKVQGIALFIEGFGHLFPFSKDKQVLLQLFLPSFDYSMVYVCLIDENVVGFLGIGNSKKQPVHFEVDTFKKLFGGIKGSILCSQLRTIAEKPAVKKDTDLYIDFLVTDKVQRSKGIATALLNFACELYAQTYQECHIEVLSKNTSAKRLYEKLGFVAYHKSFNPFTLSQGLGVPIKMKKAMPSL